MKPTLFSIVFLVVATTLCAQEVGDTVVVIADGQTDLIDGERVAGTIPKGSRLKVEDVDGDWLNVTWKGTNGWIEKSDVASIAGTALGSSEDKQPRKLYEKEDGFSYDPPKAWKIINYPGVKHQVTHGIAKDGFAPNINTVLKTNSMKLAEYVDASIRGLKKGSKELALLKREDFKTEDGLVGVRLLAEISYENKDGAADTRLRQTFFFFARGDEKLLLTVSVLFKRGDASDEMFKKSMKTFRFHEPKK